jgi:hypothetical protein
MGWKMGQWVNFGKVHFVIPNRAESPGRNPLFAGQTADSLRDKNAPRNNRFQTDALSKMEIG